MRKGSQEAKAWGKKMKRLREGKKTKRKTTTRKRRTTRKGDLTLKRRKAYPRTLRKSTLSNLARKRRKSSSTSDSFDF